MEARAQEDNSCFLNFLNEELNFLKQLRDNLRELRDRLGVNNPLQLRVSNLLGGVQLRLLEILSFVPRFQDDV